ncbi:MAG: hypothetical protein L0Z54_06270, partial [Thermoplasmata archaeon]|nr:hypothetical protein [Thermoplasmata archaeon]
GRHIVGLIVMAFIVVIVVGSAEAQILPTFSWNFYDGVEYVDVEPGVGNGTAHFCGILTVDSPDPYLSVDLSADLEGGGASIEPSNIVKWGPGSEDFPVNVTGTLPLGIPRAVRQLMLGGEWTNGVLVGNVPDQMLVICVLPYYGVDVGIADETSCERASQVNFSVELTNQGNAQDRYRIEIVNIRDLADDGWSVPTIGTVSLQMGESKSLTIVLGTPDDTGTWTMHLKVTSDYSDMSGWECFWVEVSSRLKVEGGGSGGDDDDGGIENDLSYVGGLEYILVIALALALMRKRSLG